MTDPRPSQYREQILANFVCQNTGNCCRAEGYVYVTDRNMADMAEALELSVGEFKSRYTVIHNGWHAVATPHHRPGCFLDGTNKCQVYKGRPLACKTYPNWPEIWKDDVTVVVEMSQCKGLSKAWEVVKNECKVTKNKKL